MSWPSALGNGHDAAPARARFTLCFYTKPRWKKNTRRWCTRAFRRAGDVRSRAHVSATQAHAIAEETSPVYAAAWAATRSTNSPLVKIQCVYSNGHLSHALLCFLDIRHVVPQGQDALGHEHGYHTRVPGWDLLWESRLVQIEPEVKTVAMATYFVTGESSPDDRRLSFPLVIT